MLWVRTSLRTFLPIKTHSRAPSKKPSWNLLERSLENPSKNPSEGVSCCTTPMVSPWLLRTSSNHGQSRDSRLAICSLIHTHAQRQSQTPSPRTFSIQNEDKRATTNVQNGVVFFFLFSLKKPSFKEKSWGKSSEKMRKIVENCEKCEKVPKRFCPLIVAL